MAYIYQVTFYIEKDQMGQLEIGAALERTLGYLRTLLPSSTGYVAARAYYSLDLENEFQVCFESEWDRWEDVGVHSRSSLAEDKILREFEPHVDLSDLTVHVFSEVD